MTIPKHTAELRKSSLYLAFGALCLAGYRLAGAARAQSGLLRELEVARKDKERLLARTLEVAERERMRIAGVLHDGPIQRLTAATLRLDLVASRLRRGDHDGALQYTEQVRAELGEEMTAIREQMTELRSPVLDEGGLQAALQDCSLQVLEGADIRARVTSEIGRKRFAPEVETAIYRIAREALRNARKHSQATEVELSLTAQAGQLKLVVSDNGEGFDTGQLREERLGLVGMRDMAEGLGGRWLLTSTPESGTRVEVLVPRKEATTSATAGVAA